MFGLPLPSGGRGRLVCEQLLLNDSPFRKAQDSPAAEQCVGSSLAIRPSLQTCRPAAAPLDMPIARHHNKTTFKGPSSFQELRCAR